jgi:hypothetical protein
MVQLTPEYIVVGLGILLALWYLGASIFNRRRGVAVFRWLRADPDSLSGESSGRWIGSSGSGAELHVRKMPPPLKELQLIYLLASRELLPLFLVDLVRGKRDRLIVKATYRATPIGELEAVPASSGLARQLRAGGEDPWQVEEGPHGLRVGARGREADKLRAALTPLLEKYGPYVQRVSWSRKPPHLIAILSLAGLTAQGGRAADLYGLLVTIAPSTRPAPEEPMEADTPPQ